MGLEAAGRKSKGGHWYDGDFTCSPLTHNLTHAS